jgi:PhoPQ-activated pathogenicity-related protein
MNPCTISSDTIVVCVTPPYVSSDFERRKRSIGQNININYDDYQAISTIYYIDNPIFDQLSPIEYDKESTILITVTY